MAMMILRCVCGMTSGKPNGFGRKRKSPADQAGLDACLDGGSVFVLVEEEVILARVIRPDVLDAFIQFALVFHLLEVFDDLERRAGADRVIDQLVARGRPWGLF